MPGPLLMVNPRKPYGSRRKSMPKRRYKRRVVRRRRNAKRSFSRPKITSYGTTKLSGKRHPKRKSRRSMKRTAKRRKLTSAYGKLSTKRKSTTKKRKSPKRVAAGKKAARTRKRRAASRKRSYKKSRKTTKRKSPKRVAAGKKAARTRKRRAASRKRSYKKSRKTTRRKSTKRSRAMKRAWAKRRRGGYKVKRGSRRYRRLYRTKKGRPYKRARTRRGKFVRWRNQVKGWAMGIGLGGVALYLSELITGFSQKKLEEKGYASKLKVAGANMVPIAVPLAISFGLMKYGNKVIKDANIRSTLSMAFGMAGMLAALNIFVVPKLPAGVQQVTNNMSGYVVSNRSLRGYVRSNMRGYVRSMGAVGLPTSRMLSAGRMSGLPAASFGQGSGLDVERRFYDKYQWGGVLSKNVFED